MRDRKEIAGYAMRGLALLALPVVAASLWLACGDDDDGDSGSPVDGGAEANVVLDEWSVTPDVTTVSPGTVTFAAKNEGAMPHELVVVKTDVAADALPVSAGKADEEAAGEVIGEIEPEDLPAGGEAEAVFDLDPGRYLLICNIAGHYEQGMYAELTVE